MNFIEAVVMGIVQGLTEFLPISSSAHLRLVPVVLNMPDPGAAFSAVIQLGTVLAVIIYFWKDLAAAFVAWAGSLTDQKKRETPEAKMGWAVFIGTLPVIVAGLALKKFISTPQWRSLYVVAFSMIGMAIVMMLAEMYSSKKKSIDEVQPKDGLIPGLLQCLALVPGMSRSGSTITGAFFSGFDRKAAIRFSFLMSVPSVAGAGFKELYDNRHSFADLKTMLLPTVTATVIAFVVGYACIAWLLKWIGQHGTKVFVIYRIILGIVLVILLAKGSIQAIDTNDKDASLKVEQPLYVSR